MTDVEGKTVLYARVAAADAGAADKLNQQVEQLKAALPADLDKDRIEVYAEIGSGNLGIRADLNGRVRREYQRLFDDICRRKVECVYAADPSRLSRNRIDLSVFVDTCREHNVKIIAGGREFSTRDVGIGESTIEPANGIAAVVKALDRETHAARCLLGKRMKAMRSGPTRPA